MVWIPGGALVAGTPPDHLPRIADEEMPGEQVILKGFYIDIFAYPNEEGAIPLSNVTRAEAAGLCAEVGKRLCTELEWERACKGPDNHVYEYGDQYRPGRCGTGTAPALRPSGLSVGCRSDFGVRDMHGGVWEWTDSPWGRGLGTELVSTRGGNAPAGELVGRCANAVARVPDNESGSVGFRCCAGPRNTAEVVLQVSRGKKLELEDKVERALVKALAIELDDSAKQELKDPADFTADRKWVWRPVGNEELVAISGCSGIARDPRCGIIIARLALDQHKVLAWVGGGSRLPSLHGHRDARNIWLLGADDAGLFKRRIAYVWGRVSVGDKERRVPEPPPKRRQKARR
jgi:sulfatase modifying factor 1